MISYIFIALISIIGSFLTFFSGFGLGTLLLPVFTLFFPFEVALVMTAIVHLFNGTFKFFLVGKDLNKKIFLQFGIAAIVFSFIGSIIFSYQISEPKIIHLSLFGLNRDILLIKMIIGIILLILTTFELTPLKLNLFTTKNYYVGGAISGFFGGLSGSQGALRSYFLKNANLNPITFVATGTSISLLIDITRIPTYLSQIKMNNDELEITPIITGIVFAFFGALLGKKFLKKVSIKSIDYIVGGSLIIFSCLLILGFV